MLSIIHGYSYGTAFTAIINSESNISDGIRALKGENWFNSEENSRFERNELKKTWKWVIEWLYY